MNTNIFQITIPELRFPLYSVIVMGGILAGVIMACLIMYRSGLNRNTIIYTALLCFVCITTFGLFLPTDPFVYNKSLGFTGAGGALGLLIGAFISLFIHRDHEKEMFAAWVICAPLMYGLSKIACHVTGCCSGIEYRGFANISYHGEDGRFPVQLSESVIFVIIFIVGLIYFIKTGKSLVTSRIVVALSVVAKFGMDYLRESHYTSSGFISNNQVLAIVCGIFAITLTELTDRVLFKPGKVKKN
ncbi:MAG: prolipoprotein diacylglyceryl transferase [Lachnospiraceae bacterium]|nr:prolipoprotein diacylglyceryl transferase [Lachnospiraceae bacterium]